MRILVLSDWMTNAGGAEVYITELREMLLTAGHDVMLLTCGAGNAGKHVADITAYGTDRRVLQSILQIVNPFAVSRVRSAVRRFRPDVVFLGHFAYHFSPAILAVLRATPTVASLMDYKAVCPIGSKLLPDHTLCTYRAGSVCWRSGCVNLPHWLRDQPRYALLELELSRVDRLLCPSRSVQRQLELNGLRAECVSLPVAPPDGDFRRVPAPVPTYLYCGRLSREKGVDLLLKAFACLRKVFPGVRLRIIGDGPQRAWLEIMADEQGLNSAVTFVGAVPHSEVSRHFNDAWALVAPSWWAEPFGIVALEAIVRGVPVIGSATGGFTETIEPGVTGLLFPNGDETALLECLIDIAESRTFSSHLIPDNVVQRVMEENSLERHMNSICFILSAVGKK